MIKLVSFDLGGTLVYSRGKSQNKFDLLAKQIGVPCKNLKDFLKPIIYCKKLSQEQIIDLLQKEFLVKIQNKNILSEIFESKKTHYVYKDTFEILKKLKNKNFKIAIVTNQNCFNKIMQFEFFDLVDYFVSSLDVGVCKPNSAIFEHLSKIANVRPDEILHLGDNINSDYYGAKNAGCYSVLIDRNKNLNFSKQKFDFSNKSETIDKINSLNAVISVINQINGK